MSTSIRRLLSKASALLILLGMIGGVVMFVIEPMTTRLATAREAIGQERKLLAALLDEARLQAAARSAKGKGDVSVLLAGDTDAERIAGLQARLEAVAVDAGVRLTSSQPTPERVAAPLRILGIRAQLGGSIEALQLFLHRIEAERPDLLVDSLEIVPSAPSSDGRPDDLEMRLTVAGGTPLQAGGGR